MGSRDQAPGMVYPRVKVRERPDPKSFHEETANLLLKVIESLSLESRYASNAAASKPGNEHKSDSPSPISGISSAHLSNLSTSSVCNGSEGNDYGSGSPSPRSGNLGARLSHFSTSSVCNGSEGRSKKSLDQDKKPNIRASSVPRPRAVLSSPDNDDMIGHQNQLLRERAREKPSKGQPLQGRSAAGQCKTTPKNVRVQSPARKRETIRVASNDNRPKTKPLLMHDRPLRQTPAKGKSNPAWI